MWYLVLFVAASFGVCAFRWVVPPYRCAVVRNRFTGAIWVVNAGEAIWIVPGIHVFECGHHFGSWFVPAVGAKLTIDPPEWHIITSDGVRGTLDIRVVVEMNAWSTSDLLRSSESLANTAKTIIQTWAANIVSTMTAAEVSNYNVLNARFNSGACHESVNTELEGVYMRVVRIWLDKGGIKLSDSYKKRLEDEMAIEATRAVSTKRFDLQTFEAAKRQELEKRQAMHAAEIQSIENDSLKKKLTVLPAEKYVDLEIGTKLASAISNTKATHVVFGQSPMGILR